ncbi:hypothetical protein GCM10010347_61910 [Streptomyces cirratus]|uniref:HTH cro/C1-type domain-containing protein n=1 Tax=Streptomyces cirratus TaxID=68187 RepID=A0ABQ3F4I4_9ACTN|nr:hypothetical protein GCM10010347_61910 [Streptomyces cirratus]
MAEADEALRTVAQYVRAARTRAGLSLEELSWRAPVSKGALVGLEKARGNPNLAALVRLADTLGVSVSALLQGMSEGRVRVVDAEAVAPLWSGEQGSEAGLMLTTSGPAPVEVWRRVRRVRREPRSAAADRTTAGVAIPARAPAR